MTIQNEEEKKNNTNLEEKKSKQNDINNTNKDNEEVVITPWVVKSFDSDYNKVIEKFGCSEVTEATIALLKKAIIKKHGPNNNIKIPHLISRGIFFAHRNFDTMLQNYIEKDEEFYLYTGRGPSSDSMHLGHAISFLFCKWLQNIFDAYVVIQMTDDEKFLVKDISLEDAQNFTTKNIKEIIGFGYNPDKTFIFSNTAYIKHLFANTLKVSKLISLNEARKVFGFDENSNVGLIEYPCRQIAPCFSSSFEFFEKQGKKKMNCMIPAAIDQDPYFRLARDKAKKLKQKKPSSIYSKFLPSLLGSDSKMSASIDAYTIYLNDSEKDIRKKIKKYAFSGGKETVAEHRKYGGNTSVDIAYVYLTYFLEDDEKLNEIKVKYESGEMLSGELKEICGDVIVDFVREFQKKVNEVDDDLFKKFTEQ